MCGRYFGILQMITDWTLTIAPLGLFGKVERSIYKAHCVSHRARWLAGSCPLGPSSFMRMTVGSRGMFVGKLAMFESRSRVILRLFVLAEIVMMGRLVVMMRGGVVVSGRLMVMLTRRMLRCRCHLRYSSLRMNVRA
jgi:hypothetical protein